MTLDPHGSLYWLVDAGALHVDELVVIKQLPGVRWLYAHLKDEQAQCVGPVVLPADTDSTALLSPLQQDDARFWAVSMLQTQATFDHLLGHLLRLRYIHTHDGQRYYWRFADSRSLLALWPDFTPHQQQAVFGVISSWAYQSRSLETQILPFPNLIKTDRTVGLTRLNINANQLTCMLKTSWPDQLLAAVQEDQPTLLMGLNAKLRHDYAKRVSDWLAHIGETRYPVQTAVLVAVLSRVKTNWDDEAWQSALASAHAPHSSLNRI